MLKSVSAQINQCSNQSVLRSLSAQILSEHWTDIGVLITLLMLMSSSFPLSLQWEEGGLHVFDSMWASPLSTTSCFHMAMTMCALWLGIHQSPSLESVVECCAITFSVACVYPGGSYYQERVHTYIQCLTLHRSAWLGYIYILFIGLHIPEV